MVGHLLLRFGVFKNDREVQSIALYEDASTKQIENALLAAIKKVEWELRDFPEQLRKDIKSGKFMHVLYDYEQRRCQYFELALKGQMVLFKDYGAYDSELFFKDKVDLYDRIITEQKASL